MWFHVSDDSEVGKALTDPLKKDRGYKTSLKFVKSFEDGDGDGAGAEVAWVW